jgi:hypothetical protein
MARPRSKKSESSSREARLRKRAASRGFSLVKEQDAWYAAIGGTRFGPLRTLDEVDEFLPKEA